MEIENILAKILQRQVKRPLMMQHVNGSWPIRSFWRGS